MFAGTSSGAIRAIKFPLGETGEWQEYQAHCGTVSRVRNTSVPIMYLLPFKLLCSVTFYCVCKLHAYVRTYVVCICMYVGTYTYTSVYTYVCTYMHGTHTSYTCLFFGPWCSWPCPTMTSTCSLLGRTGRCSCSRWRTRRAGGSSGTRRLCSQRRFSSPSQIWRRRCVRMYVRMNVHTYVCTCGYLTRGFESGGPYVRTYVDCVVLSCLVFTCTHICSDRYVHDLQSLSSVLHAALLTPFPLLCTEHPHV